MAKYFMGIDNGGSNIKCVIFDEKGKQMGKGSRQLPLLTPAPGMTERKTEDVWLANLASIRDAIADAGIDGHAVAAIGLTGYGNGACFVDKHGVPTYHCIVSTDSRTADYLARWQADGTAKQVYDLTYQDIWAAQPAALLPWFRDHNPEVLQKSAYTLAMKDYIRFKLTGELCGEITDASSGCLMNIKTRKYDPEIFRILGIEEYTYLTPPFVDSVDVSGRVTKEAAALTGLAEGTPVAGGYFDIDAGALASGVLRQDTLSLIAGTWSINEYITDDLESGYGKFSNTVGYLPNHYVVEDSSPTSASNFNWFVQRFYAQERQDMSNGELYRFCDSLLENITPYDSDVVFVPYLYASATNPNSRATFLNVTGFNTREHMMRAVYEGVVFSTMFHVKRLTGKDRARYRTGRLSGGLTQAPAWTQMMCDVLQMPIEVLRGEELSAQGAAMGAAVACGHFADCPQAVEAMVQVAGRFDPNPALAEVYARKFAVFEKALKALDLFHTAE